MKKTTLLIVLGGLISCGETDESNSNDIEQSAITFQNKGHELVYGMVQKVGDFSALAEKKDVVYTYTYETPTGAKDISTEKYIFEGELSYGEYIQHERTLPELSGTIEQGYDGNDFWLRHNGQLLEQEPFIKKVAFNRPTNYYWFTMMQKLLDPGIIYTHVGQTKDESTTYDIVKINFESEEDVPTDTYQLYINQSTQLVDKFLFTVVDYGVNDPNLMVVEYETIDGIMLPTKRKYKKSNWDAIVSQDPWTTVNWTEIKFNNNLNSSTFKKEATEMKDNNIGELQAQLEAKKALSQLKGDSEKKRKYQEGLESVEKSGIVESAKQVGDMAPNFNLKNATGETVALSTYLKKGPVVLTWYRGGWCPYCNLTLSQLQKELPNFLNNGANLIALTPELPDSSLNTSEKNNLEFEILSDIGNKVAREYGIVFKLTEDVASIYHSSFNMNGYNGDESNELPLAATYIINQNGEIVYAFLDADYRNRAEPSDITEFLMRM